MRPAPGRAVPGRGQSSRSAGSWPAGAWPGGPGDGGVRAGCPGRALPISRTRSISSPAWAVCAAEAVARTLRSALRVAAANGVFSSRASDTAIATISAAVKFSGGRVSVLSIA